MQKCKDCRQRAVRNPAPALPGLERCEFHQNRHDALFPPGVEPTTADLDTPEGRRAAVIAEIRAVQGGQRRGLDAKFICEMIVLYAGLDRGRPAEPGPETPETPEK